MKLTVKITRYPRYRPGKAIHKADHTECWVIMVQRWAKSKWLISTLEGNVQLYATLERAQQVARWLNDPEGTKSEWDTEAQTPSVP